MKPKVLHKDNAGKENGQWTATHKAAIEAADRIFNTPPSKAYARKKKQ